MTDHPITPPLELVDSIWNQFKTGPTRNLLTSEAFREAITKASQWGADQELEACIAFVRRGPWCSEKLRATRRPKLPSLKEQALAALERYEAEEWCEEMTFDSSIIRRALEALND